MQALLKVLFEDPELRLLLIAALTWVITQIAKQLWKDSVQKWPSKITALASSIVLSLAAALAAAEYKVAAVQWGVVLVSVVASWLGALGIHSSKQTVASDRAQTEEATQ